MTHNQINRPKRHSVSLLAGGFVAMISMAAASSPALAQDVHRIDFSAGFLNVAGSMNGANAQLNVPISRHWSFVTEFNKATGPDCKGCEPTFHDTSGLGGIRYNWLPTR